MHEYSDNVMVIDGVKVPLYLLEMKEDAFKIIYEGGMYSLVMVKEDGGYEYWFSAHDDTDILEGYLDHLNQNLEGYRARYRISKLLNETFPGLKEEQEEEMARILIGG